MSRQRTDGSCEEKSDYPFAMVLRLRVVQVVCGISTVLMGAVALIEEKNPFNLGIGVPAGTSTVIAAAYNIYCSRGFDGYQPSSCKQFPVWRKLRILGPTIKVGSINVALWSFAGALLITLVVKAVKELIPDIDNTISMGIIAGAELLLTFCVFCTIIIVTWVDSHYDPDYQEPPDLAHSNTGTAVSMVTLSQTAPA